MFARASRADADDRLLRLQVSLSGEAAEVVGADPCSWLFFLQQTAGAGGTS